MRYILNELSCNKAYVGEIYTRRIQEQIINKSSYSFIGKIEDVLLSYTNIDIARYTMLKLVIFIISKYKRPEYM